jgi:hypothetical protein
MLTRPPRSLYSSSDFSLSAVTSTAWPLRGCSTILPPTIRPGF